MAELGLVDPEAADVALDAEDDGPDPEADMEAIDVAEPPAEEVDEGSDIDGFVALPTNPTPNALVD